MSHIKNTYGDGKSFEEIYKITKNVKDNFFKNNSIKKEIFWRLYEKSFYNCRSGSKS